VFAFTMHQSVRLPLRSRAAAYVALTKPRIIELLLVTTVPTMVVAARGVPGVWLMINTVVGGTLAAGGANAINMYVDRDIDKLMKRTRHRPLVTGAVTPRAALTFAIAVEAVAFVWLAVWVNLLSAVLAVGACLFYVFVYTLWLKRTSTRNIVIGGAAGAVPVLVGWASVTGDLSAPAWVLFAIVFFWTPPHFWALSLRYYDDYEAAGIPMLPVAKGVATALREIAVYSVVVVATTLVLPLVADTGVIYLVAAIVLGVAFILRAMQLVRASTPTRAIKFFTFSNVYLALLFAAIAIDTLVLSL
jgi:protoheme IX farnesyltransferase